VKTAITIMTISDATISSDVWNTIKAIIVAAAPKITNSKTSTTKTAGIYASYNDKSFKMPGIVIDPAEISESDYKFGTNIGKRFINIVIGCYYKNTLGTDQLSDQVNAALANASISGMEMVGFDSTQAFVDPNQAKFQLKTIVFTFERE
jgi:hypothetical protein